MLGPAQNCSPISSTILTYLDTVVGDYISIMKTIFAFDIDLYQAFKQHEYNEYKSREKVSFGLLVNL